MDELLEMGMVVHLNLAKVKVHEARNSLWRLWEDTQYLQQQ